MFGSGSRKRGLLLFWITLLVLFAFSPSSLAAQSGGVTLQAEPFFQGHYKFGEWLPLRITVTNTGASVTADVRVEMTAAGGQTSWLVPVQLPTGAQKQFTLYILPPSFAQVARVRVVNGSQELAKQNTPLTLHPNNEYLVGIVAPRNEPFNVVNGTTLEGGIPRTVRALPISLNDLPERFEGLRALDALVLTDVDTSTLTPAQTNALTVWLQKGGRLIVGGGASAARTLAGLPDNLVAEFRGQNNIDEVKTLQALGEFVESQVRVQGPFVVALPSSGEALLLQGQRTLLAEKRVGDGYVTYSALDLAASPFDAWAGASRFWKKILSPGSAYPQNTPTDVSPNLIRTRYMALAMQNLPVLALPSLNILSGLLIAYIVLVGPVNYFALRRFKKLDWGWVTIPGLTLLFAIGAFGVSNQMRGGDVILNQVSIVDFGADGAAREMQTVVGLFSPTRGSFNLELPDSGLVIPVSNQYDPFSSQQSSGTNVEIVETNPLVVRGIELNQAALQAFAIESPAPTDWRIETKLTVDGERVRGQVVNRLNVPLSDVVLVTGDRHIRLGEIAPQQTREIDEDWKPFGGYIGNIVVGNTPNHEARRQILGARFDTWRGSGNLNTAPLLIAWLDSSPFDARVQNTLAAREIKTLAIAPLNLRYSGALRLGINDWQIREISSSGERTNCGQVNYTGIRNGELVLDFLPPSYFKIASVTALKLLVREGAPQTVELQDAKDEWVTVTPTAPGEYALENPQRFLKANGAVRMRISSKDSFDRCVLYGLDLEGEIGE